MTSLLRSIREWMQRVLGSLRGGRTDEDLAEELRAHVELAAEDGNRSRASADTPQDLRTRRTMDTALESLRDQRGLPWLDALKSDAIFGWRQILRHRTASMIAVLSLGLSIGATATAFRLVDAILLRPAAGCRSRPPVLPAALLVDSHGEPDTREDFDYPTYRETRDLLKDTADVMVVGMSHPVEATIGANRPERALPPAVRLGQRLPAVRPAARGRPPARTTGRRRPGAHPVAVLSHDCWTLRFARDPRVVGSTVRINGDPFEIVGVAPEGFIGTEPGLVPDVFVPATMNTEALNAHGWSWFRSGCGRSPGRGARDDPPDDAGRLRSRPAGAPQGFLRRHAQAHHRAFPRATHLAAARRHTASPRSRSI